MTRKLYFVAGMLSPYPILVPMVYDPIEGIRHDLDKIGKQVESYAFCNKSLEKMVKELNKILAMLAEEPIEGGGQVSVDRETLELKTKTLELLKYYKPILAHAKTVSLATQSLPIAPVNSPQKESKECKLTPPRSYTRRLPNDSFINEVAQFLDVYDMLRMRRVCREWRKQTDQFCTSEKYLNIKIKKDQVVLDISKISSGPILLKDLISLVDTSMRNDCMRTRWFYPLCFWKKPLAEKFNHAIKLTLSERKKEDSPDDPSTLRRISLKAFLQT